MLTQEASRFEHLLDRQALGQIRGFAAALQFLYDGLNPIQERSGGSVSASILTGLGVDEFFKRTEASNTEHY